MSESVWGNKETEFFFSLAPEVILEAIEALGLKVTGRCLTLNSMENRVYEVEVINDEAKQPSENFVIVKFYRPGRWSKEQIQDEHDFLTDLKNNDIPVIAPITFEGKSVFVDKTTDLYYCLFPKKGGRIPQEMTREQLEITGRLLARIHSVGASKASEHRLHINEKTFGLSNLQFLLDKKVIPHTYESQYKDFVEEICELTSPLLKNREKIRIHGDCHWGNLISRDEEIFFIDFDDMLIGPPVQDVWLVVPGIDAESVRRRDILLDAYEMMRDFDYSSLKLIEPLRALRYIHFSAWIAKRFEDPAFQNAFPHYKEDNYWSIQVNDLQTQLFKIRSINNEIY